MLVQRAKLYPLEPTPEQAEWLAQTAGACRYVYNLALEQRRDHWRKAKFSWAQQCREVTECRAEADWLRAAPVHALQQACKDLDTAFDRFFCGLGGYPRPREKFKDDTFRLPDPSYLGFKRLSKRMGAIKLPKIGWIKCRDWRSLGGELRNVTIKCKAGKWYASIAIQREVAAPAKSVLPAVGIDRGVKVFAALSTGKKIAPLNSFRKIETKLAKLQRRLARKTKFSANWRKLKAKISRLHSHAANARKDYLHKVSTEIAKNHGIVKVEALRIKNMSASAKGTVETPGRKVAQKSGLNKAILDQGWGMFAGFLGYKLPERGGELQEVPAPYTSQECPECHHICSDNRKSRDEFECVACGFAEDADIVGSRNILAARILAPKPPKRTLPKRVGKRNQAVARAAVKECSHAAL
jgi:putative transposase